MNVYCIYAPNGKRYVGVEKQHGRRIRDHRNMVTLRKGRKDRPQVIDLAIRKHGWENCRWRYLATNCSNEDGWALEKFFIKTMRLQDPEWGYNISAGGKNAAEGCKRTDAMKAHHSAVMKALKRGPTPGSFKPGHRPALAGTKGRIKAWNKGIPMAEETRHKLSEAKKGQPSWNKGQPMTAEHKDALSRAKKGKAKATSTSFQSGGVPHNKGKKTGKPAWNAGTKGVSKANGGTFKPGMGGQRGKIALPAGPNGERRWFRPEQLI